MCESSYLLLVEERDRSWSVLSVCGAGSSEQLEAMIESLIRPFRTQIIVYWNPRNGYRVCDLRKDCLPDPWNLIQMQHVPPPELTCAVLNWAAFERARHISYELETQEIENEEAKR